MIVFDTEISPRNNKIQDIGAITSKNREFHDKSIEKFEKFIKKHKSSYFAGHNIVKFDLKYLEKAKFIAQINKYNVIDTLYLSALFFPKKPYHNLIKDDKIESDYLNNPLNDAKKSFHLLNDAINEFNKLDIHFKQILYSLLNDQMGFGGFFKYIGYSSELDTNEMNLKIRRYFGDKICQSKNIDALGKTYPIELSFALSYINTNDTSKSLLPAWILNNFSKVEDILLYLRGTPCESNCEYCKNNLTGQNALKKYFGYSDFRKFDGKNIQEQTVNSALNNESLLAIFPTGGGKSLTFQIPALIMGENIGGLTVVISPLQALMKDQVDNLHEKFGITNVAFINGLLNPFERKETIDRVIDGTVSILYLSPEALRSKTIYNLLLRRQVVRFVIDEAHCFSTWGHDFRTDYLYIATFIKNLTEKKELTNTIPISCFTATAKQDVIEDIKNYFKSRLDLDLSEFISTSGRTNLMYKVKQVTDDQNRYQVLRELLESDKRPTIIYASRTKVIETLFQKLSNDKFSVSKFYGKMDNADKIKNQEEFMSHKTNIMIATNAFGMGVDKDDVGVVIHYNISDSLENYVQEAGRAGRNPESYANCYILYNEEDLEGHFDLLNLNKVSIKEISQVWKGIKYSTKTRNDFSKSALEIARISGWNESEMMETRVKTSILALEDAGFIERGFNSPRVFATSLLVKSVEDAKKVLSKNISKYKNIDSVLAVRIISSLVSSKYKSWQDEVAESKIDYLSDNLGISKETTIYYINIFKDIGILANENDLYAKISSETNQRGIITNINRNKAFLDYIIENLTTEKKQFNIKELNENFVDRGYKQNIVILRRLINYLERVKVIEKKIISRDIFIANLTISQEEVITLYKKYFEIAEFISGYLIEKKSKIESSELKNLVPFSSIEVKNEYAKSSGFISLKSTFTEVQEVILMMQILDIMSFEGGFLVSYNPMYIRRIEENNNLQYRIDHYNKLKNHFDVKNQQIHIVGMYAEMMMKDKSLADQFVSDYFNIDYKQFIEKYFPGHLANELNYRMSVTRYKKLFGKLSDEQMAVINDSKSPVIGVAAGPGSGKTMLLTHKLASIIYNEDIRSEQLLMLTFSRNAAIEFRERLFQLIGTAANYIEITTFHAFAFDLLGRPGTLEASDRIIPDAVELIRNNEADKFKITKTMLVIDEAQDMRDYENDLVREIIKQNDDIRVIAVGDDDQNIFSFRKSDSKYLKEFADEKKYELSTNYRSKNLLVEYANEFIKRNKNRIKTKVIKSNYKEQGEIRITTYQSDNLVTALTQDVMRNKNEGTTAILSSTNEEALLISGILNDYGLSNRLIQDLGNSKPFNHFEIRYFYMNLKRITDNKIDMVNWNKVYALFETKYKQSTSFYVTSRLLDKFIEVYPEPYISDLREYLLESEFSVANDKVIISTIHKIKGMEFDNVYMLFDKKFNNFGEKENREIYVGITRAKSFLSIHSSNTVFRDLKLNEVQYINDSNQYPEPNVIELIFDLKSVFLGYAKTIQNNLENIISGDTLTMDRDSLYYKNKIVAKLSKGAKEKIAQRIQKGFKITEVSVEDLVFWYDREDKEEFLILIPRIKFVR